MLVSQNFSFAGVLVLFWCTGQWIFSDFVNWSLFASLRHGIVIVKEAVIIC